MAKRRFHTQRTFEVEGRRFRLPSLIGVTLPEHWQLVTFNRRMREMPDPPTIRRGESLEDVAFYFARNR